MVTKVKRVRLSKIERVYNGRKYTYYTLPLNTYIPKHVAEKYGKEYVVIRDTETGVVIAMPHQLLSAILLSEFPPRVGNGKMERLIKLLLSSEEDLEISF